MVLSDTKIIDKLNFICEFFYKFKSEVSLEIIEKSTKLINFVEYSRNYAIEISSDAIVEILNFIKIVEKHVKYRRRKNNGIEA